MGSSSAGKLPDGGIDIDFVTQRHNKPNDPLKVLFERYGFEVSWDFDKRTGEYWNEIMSHGKLVFQIQQGVSLKAFKIWLDADKTYQPPFFIASELPEKKYLEFIKTFYDMKKKEFKKV